ncbi:MAG: PLP-dependent aminotransferase family protein, partial [Pseudomonadota bacterium]
SQKNLPLEKIKLGETKIINTELPDGRNGPGLDILPREILAKAADHSLSQNDNTFLNYGYNAGDGLFHRALAGFLSGYYNYQPDPDHLFVTAGSSMALDLVCTRFTKPGDTIIVEQPTYFLAHQIFEDHGLKMIGVRMESDGMNLNQLERLVSEHAPKLVYTVPSFHNPTGITLSDEKRQRLAELSRHLDFIVVADEVYQLLNFSMKSLPAPMSSYSSVGNILSLGTFSKILAPGLRLGWIECNPEFRSRLQFTGFVDSGGSVNHFTSAIVRSAIELGLLQQVLDRYIAIYRQRVDTMHKSLLAREIEAVWEIPDGGFFFWLNMGKGFDGRKLVETASAHDLGLISGDAFTTDGSLSQYIRLSFAYFGDSDIEEGMQRFRMSLDSMR